MELSYPLNGKRGYNSRMTFDEILRRHLGRYPLMQVQDVYKLAHQAALGSEHAATDPERAWAWLQWEVASLGDGPAEPLLDPISLDGQIARVHLRPYLAQGGDVQARLQALLHAFLHTAQAYPAQTQALEVFWQQAVQLEHFPPAEMRAFFEPRQAAGFPAAHHSPAFGERYRPAYRVVWTALLVLPGAPGTGIDSHTA